MSRERTSAKVGSGFARFDRLDAGVSDAPRNISLYYADPILLLPRHLAPERDMNIGRHRTIYRDDRDKPPVDALNPEMNNARDLSSDRE